MNAFGWTIEYTLSLPLPQFLAVSGLVSRARADAAIDGVFSAYCAGKYGGKSADALFKARGAFFLNTGNRSSTSQGYTPEMLERAQRRANELAAAGNLEKAQGKS